jgi:hypothetical protein
LAVIDVAAGDVAEGEALSLEPAAEMYVLLSGLRASMNHLPFVADAGTGTRVVHPGYAG